MSYFLSKSGKSADRKKYFLWFLSLLVLFFFSTITFAQSVKKFNKLLRKNDLPAFRKKLDKELQKTPESAALQYFLSVYFFQKDSASLSNLDSVHRHLIAAQQYFTITSVKVKENWRKDGFMESTIQRRKKYADSLAFVSIKKNNQVQGYNYFIERFENAEELQEAILLRNELAYRQALLAENPDSLKDFMEHYPDARQIPEARQQYETLLFKKQTANETLPEFEEFIRQNPDSPYRRLAEQSVFQLATLFHTPEVYLDFIRRFSENAFIPTARQWFYNLALEKDEDYFKSHPTLLQDIAWKNIILVNETTLYPVLEDDKYGFINSEGMTMIIPRLDSIATEYFCEGITDNYVKFYKNGKTGLTNKIGIEIVKPVFDTIEKLETSLLKSKLENRQGILHETGFEILPPVYDSVKVLGNKLLQGYKNNKLLLFSRNGRKLAESEKINIECFDDSLLVFQKDAKYALYTHYDLFLNQKLSLDFKYDMAEITANQALKLVKDSLEWLCLSRHNISSGWLDTTHLMPELLQLEKHFEKVSFSKDYFLVKAKNGKLGLFSAKGKKILNTKYEQIEVWNDKQFKVKLNEKYGIADEGDKMILKAEFDGLETLGSGYIATLKDGKFGLLTLNKKILIQPQYESLIRQYDPLQKYFTAKKDEKLGLITTDNHQVTDFVFDEIIYWQPSVALVRISEFWHLYDIPEKRFVFKPLAEIVFQKTSGQELIIKVMSENKYGLFSNKQGILANTEYDALTNIGTPEKPFYIAEKYLREVDVYLLYYYNEKGKAVHRQALTQGLYEKITCE